MKTDIVIVATAELPANRRFAAVSGSVSVRNVIKTDRIMWKLINGIRRARIAKNQTRLAHLEARYERFERKGWVALP